MRKRKRNSARTKNAILEAARHLFARDGIASVSIRDIAREAGISHGLIQQYFGSRKQLVAAIIRKEIEDFGRSLEPGPSSGTQDALEIFRARLKTGGDRFQDYAMLIARAELEGVKPERFLDPAVPTPAVILAEMIRDLQTKSARPGKLDPRLVSAYVNASLFAFATMSPWLMTSVGMKPEDYGKRLGEIADISVRLLAIAIGSAEPPPKPRKRRPSR